MKMYIFVSFVAGGIFGMIIMSCLAAASDTEKEMEKYDGDTLRDK